MSAAWLTACAVVGLGLGAACAGGDKVNDAPAPDAAQRRGRTAPTGQVHAYPPHAIRSDGVGPYILGQQLSDVMRLFPTVPPVEVLQIPRCANWRVVHVDGDALFIGGDSRGEVAFVVVLRPDIARTASGAAVGASLADLDKTLGPERTRRDLVRDPRVRELAALPGVRFVLDAGGDVAPEKTHVVAVVVARPDDDRVAEPEAPATACNTGGALAGAVPEILAVARGKQPGPTQTPAPQVRFGCFTGATPEAVVALPSELVVVGGEPGKLRRIAAIANAPLDILTALDTDGDGKDEIVSAGQRRGDKEVAVEVRVIRWDGKALSELAVERPYVIGDLAAAAVGATPADLDLLAEVHLQRGTLEIGGLYVARGPDGVREAAPLIPVALKLDARHPTTQPAAPEPETKP